MLDDTYLIGINYTIFSLGFDLLHTLIMKAPAIKPTTCCKKAQNPIIRWSHSAKGLESTMGVLLSNVVRIASLEASRGNKPVPKDYIPLKYSSLEVMQMARTLLGFYSPSVQIDTLSLVCQYIKTNQNRVILPKALDFMRPVLMEMCNGMGQCNDTNTAHDNMAVIQKISNLLDTFLLDLDRVFEDSTSPLPTDIGEFMSCTEIYSSVFATIQLQRLWISRFQATTERSRTQEDVAAERFNQIGKWMNGCLVKLELFGSSLTRLINFWEASEDPPEDWHRLFLLQLSLQDALKQPNE